MAARTRVLIPIAEPIGGQMSAVGIRQYEVGKALASNCDVTFASSAAHNDEQQEVSITSCRSRAEFRALLKRHDVLYTLGLNSDRFLDVVRSGIRVILDIYTPLAFEILEMWPEVPSNVLSVMHRRVVRWTLAQLSLADFVVCTNEQQRDLWLGAMNAAGILDAAEVRSDPDCRSRVGVVPFGVPDGAPTPRGSPIREMFPEFGPEDFILLWSSKILAWQDPLSLLRAVHLLREEKPPVRLVFVGIGTPLPPEKRSPFNTWELRTTQAFQLADELRLTGKHVFFVKDRIPYREIGAWYLDADAGIATYPATLETHFCLGSRLLDYVWSNLPMVVSGDELQKRFVEGCGLGYAVPPHDPAALASAICRLREDISTGKIQAAHFECAKESLRWSKVTKPVLRYCQSKSATTRHSDKRRLRALWHLSEFAIRSFRCRLAARGIK